MGGGPRRDRGVRGLSQCIQAGCDRFRSRLQPPDLLSPETAQSYEAGLKGAARDGRLTYQAELFLMNFNNLVVATPSGELANAAAEKLKGVELETRFLVRATSRSQPALPIMTRTSRDNLFFDGVSTVDVAGRQLPLSPHVLAAAGLLYTPSSGFNSTLVAQYVGRRFLDEENIAPVGGYTALDATLGYVVRHFKIALQGTNLTTNGRRCPRVSSAASRSTCCPPAPCGCAWATTGVDPQRSKVSEGPLSALLGPYDKSTSSHDPRFCGARCR